MPTVSSLWIGDSISNLEKLCIKSFLDHGFKYNLYTYKPDIQNVPEGVILKNANKILSEDKVFKYKTGFNKGSVSGFSNLFRYKLLYQKGGVWVDTDLAALSDTLNFKKSNTFVTEVGSPPSGKFASALMKAEKGCPVLKECLKTFKRVNVNHISHGQTGPELVTKKINETEISENSRVEFKSKTNHFPIHWEKTERLFYDDIDINKEWKTLHFWNAWIQNELNLDKNGSYPKWSIFERLKEKHLNG